MRLRKLVTMREALESPAYFGTMLSGASWQGWRALLVAIVGEELTDEERIIFAALTDREREPLEPIEEFWGAIGRRGGKTRAMAILGSYLAACVDHRHVLAPGERGVLPIMAASTLQAGQAFNFVEGIFRTSAHLKELVENVISDTLSLSTGVDIQVRPASFRTIRGISAIAAIADEIAFWRSDDAANPDKEILNALRPSLATTGGMLVCISSPHAKRGELYATVKRHFGPAGHPLILVAKASSRTLNPSLSQGVVDRAYEEDPAAARAEYGGLFRNDLETFLSRDLIDNAVDRGILVRPPRPDIRYVGYVDAASGVGKDSFAIAIAHAEGEQIIVDLAHEIRPEFNPTSATEEVAALLKSYRVTTVRGDKYAAGFVIAAHSKCGINYLYSDNDTSTNYLDALPLFTSGRVRLVDNDRMAAQFAGLERRTGPSGRDRVDHAAGDRHDDISAAVSGALVMASQRVIEPTKHAIIQVSGSVRGVESGHYADAAEALAFAGESNGSHAQYATERDFMPRDFTFFEDR